jgi:hypothetical protein
MKKDYYKPKIGKGEAGNIALHSGHRFEDGTPNTLANAYESFWNMKVMDLPKWKQDIIVNHEDEHPEWDRIQNELTKDVIREVESVESL